MVDEMADHVTQAGEVVDQPRRFAFPRAERRRLARIAAKFYVIRQRKPRAERRSQPNRATRRAILRAWQRDERATRRAWQRRLPVLCETCQQPYIGPADFRCGCKVERQRI